MPSRERPILYSAPMVRAKLAGRKTQTRRIVNPKLLGEGGKRPFGWGTFEAEHFDSAQRVRCPYGEPGDRLWGRETFRLVSDLECSTSVRFRADETPAEDKYRWTPSIFMPRWASRLLDEVVSVRVERLHDITEADVLAEGIVREQPGYHCPSADGSPGWWTDDPRAAYFALWESINGKGAAALNPWVWRVETRPVKP